MKLYKKNKNKSIQEWKIKIVHSDLEDISRIVVQYGQLDGKMQTQVTTITVGKQGRTVVEQGRFEMLSMIRGKKDEGYKSLEDLQIKAYTDEAWVGERYNTMEGWMDLEDALNKFLPDEATDANGNIKPMLAHPIVKERTNKKTNQIEIISNWDKVIYPIAGEPKLDGVRCLIGLKECQGAVSPEDIYSLSREGKSYDFGTTKIRERLCQLFFDNGNIILDGELYVHGMPQNRISGAMRSGKYQPEIHDNMEYHVYDVINPDNTKIDYSTRRFFLEKIYMTYYKSFELGDSVRLNSRKEVDAYEIKCIEDGYEGIMLKPLNGVYEIGKRSYNNLKVKQFLDAEFEIIGYELGKRGVQDLVFICKTEDGKVFNPTATGTTAKKQTYLNDFLVDELHSDNETHKKRIIGKKAHVKFKFWSEYGVPNHCQAKDIRDYE